MFQANLLPGQGFIPFKVYKKGAAVTTTGRAVKGAYSAAGVSFYGILTSASQREIDQWKQNGHPITHKIVEYSAMKKADATDCLVNEAGTEFYVQGVRNPGGLNVTMIYYVEERFDLKLREEEAE